MIFSAEFLEKLSAQSGFQASNLEKVGYLIRILQDIADHPFLKSRLALKGGTAINLFYLDLPRLSVDIDLNYIGTRERELMLKERDPVENALTRVLSSLEMSVRRVPEQHAGGKWRIRFESIFGGSQTLELDINYLMRVPFYGTEQKESFILDTTLRVSFPVISFEEVFAGKMVAMLNRATPRDVFDVDQLTRLKQWDSTKLKKATLLIGVCGRDDWRNVSPAKISGITEKHFRQQLGPLLKSDMEHNFEQMKTNCMTFIQKLLRYDKHEQTFLTKMLDHGDYQPELIFRGDKATAGRLQKHPALLWKAQHTKEYKEK